MNKSSITLEVAVIFQVPQRTFTQDIIERLEPIELFKNVTAGCRIKALPCAWLARDKDELTLPHIELVPPGIINYYIFAQMIEDTRHKDNTTYKVLGYMNAEQFEPLGYTVYHFLDDKTRPN